MCCSVENANECNHSETNSHDEALGSWVGSWDCSRCTNREINANTSWETTSHLEDLVAFKWKSVASLIVRSSFSTTRASETDLDSAIHLILRCHNNLCLTCTSIQASRYHVIRVCQLKYDVLAWRQVMVVFKAFVSISAWSRWISRTASTAAPDEVI